MPLPFECILRIFNWSKKEGEQRWDAPTHFGEIELGKSMTEGETGLGRQNV